MKTFEERYTAWIDGQLTGDALTAFEQELARRAEAGDAEADKADALQLRALLREHLGAPALGNDEFFNHQMRQRIDAECAQAARRREAAHPAFRFPTFAWPLLRLAGVGTVCLFVAGALYYGLVPHSGPGGDNGGKLAVSSPTPRVEQPSNTQVAANNSPTPQPSVSDGGPTQLALLNTPTPAPVIDLESDDIKAHVVAPNPGNTSATPIRYQNASVLWVEGLPYLPSVDGTPAASSPAASVAPAPAGTPGANP